MFCIFIFKKIIHTPCFPASVHAHSHLNLPSPTPAPHGRRDEEKERGQVHGLPGQNPPRRVPPRVPRPGVRAALRQQRPHRGGVPESTRVVQGRVAPGVRDVGVGAKAEEERRQPAPRLRRDVGRGGAQGEVERRLVQRDGFVLGGGLDWPGADVDEGRGAPGRRAKELAEE